MHRYTLNSCTLIRNTDDFNSLQNITECNRPWILEFGTFWHNDNYKHCSFASFCNCLNIIQNLSLLFIIYFSSQYLVFSALLFTVHWYPILCLSLYGFAYIKYCMDQRLNCVCMQHCCRKRKVNTNQNMISDFHSPCKNYF